MLNKVILMGRLARDPELRRTQAGTAVTSFALAVDRDFKNQAGEKECDFLDCVAWRSTGEFVHKYFTKGQLAVVEGRLQVRGWTDKDGNKRRSTEIVVDNMYFADSKRNLDSGVVSAAAPAPAGSDGHSDFAEISEEDGELPF